MMRVTLHSDIKEATLDMDERRHVPKGTATVEYENREHAEQAIAAMDGAQIDGNLVSVRFQPEPLVRRGGADDRDRNRDRDRDREREQRPGPGPRGTFSSMRMNHMHGFLKLENVPSQPYAWFSPACICLCM